MIPAFYLTAEGAVTHGVPPEGAVLVAYTGDAPFRGRVVLATALAVVLRLHATWLPTRWDAEPKGQRARLRDAILDSASLDGASLRNAILVGASLDGASLRNAILVGASLDGASLDGASLDGASLDGASLDGASLRDAILDGASLDGASLRNASLDSASLDGASLDGASLDGASLDGASLRNAILDGASLDGAIGIATPEEEEATIANAIAGIAAEPDNWRQDVWHESSYLAAEVTEVGACGTAHCLAGWMQAQLPIGHDYRKLEPSDAGTRLAPRAAAAGWFAATTHPDLQARVDAAIKARGGE